VAYAKICYETAYLSYHYPQEFYCACINNAKNAEEAGRFISTLKKRGYHVGGVDINESEKYYYIKDGVIIPGFAKIKFFGEKSIDKFIEARGDGYKDFDDFSKRVTKSVLNKRAVESLFAAGAFDKWMGGSGFIYDELVRLYPKIDFNVIGHDEYKVCGRVIHSLDGVLMKDLIEEKSIEMLAYVVSIKEIRTRKEGKKMAFIQIENYEGRHNVIVFNKTWTKIKLKKDKLYKFKLKYYEGIVCEGAIEC
jgi:DNA polymerase-3 subunit alpha